MKTSLRIILIGLALLTLSLAVLWQRSAPREELLLLDLGEIAPFTLEDHDGNPFSSEGLRGQVWVANLFFTSCPVACPNMQQVVRGLAGKFPSVKFVSISVDPERDTTERLKKYAQTYSVNENQWFFLRGEFSTIQRIATEGFKLGAPEDIDLHSTRLVIIDPKGHVRGLVSTEEGSSRIEELLSQLISVYMP